MAEGASAAPPAPAPKGRGKKVQSARHCLHPRRYELCALALVDCSFRYLLFGLPVCRALMRKRAARPRR